MRKLILTILSLLMLAACGDQNKSPSNPNESAAHIETSLNNEAISNEDIFIEESIAEASLSESSAEDSTEETSESSSISKTLVEEAPQESTDSDASQEKSEDIQEAFDYDGYFNEVVRLQGVIDSKCVAFDERLKFLLDVWWDTWNHQLNDNTGYYTLIDPNNPSLGFNSIDGAIQRLMQSDEYFLFFKSHEEDHKNLVSTIDLLKIRPNELANLYDSLVDFLKAYEDLANLTMNPNGEFDLYLEKAKEKQDNATKANNALLDELEKLTE